MNFIITNEHLNEIVVDLKEEFNKIDFLLWYQSVNPRFKYNTHPMESNENDKYFIRVGKGVFKIIDLPELEINNESMFGNIILHDHGFYRDPLIKILKHFNIDYWEEYLKLCLDNKIKTNYINTYKILSHSLNDFEFTEKNVEKIKLLVTNAIEKINDSEVKFFSEVLQYIDFTINNKELFDNDWIVNQLNNVFKTSNNGSAKQFNFYLDKVTKKFHELDFSKIKANHEFKKILKGKIPLTKTTTCYPFFWEIDIVRYSLFNKTVQQLLQTNCITGLDLINKYLKTEYDVLSSHVTREKNVMSISVLHENPNLNEKLDFLLTGILDKTQSNFVIDRDSFEKDILYIVLNDNLNINQSIKKTVKV